MSRPKSNSANGAGLPRSVFTQSSSVVSPRTKCGASMTFSIVTFTSPAAGGSSVMSRYTAPPNAEAIVTTGLSSGTDGETPNGTRFHSFRGETLSTCPLSRTSQPLPISGRGTFTVTNSPGTAYRPVDRHFGTDVSTVTVCAARPASAGMRP